MGGVLGGCNDKCSRDDEGEICGTTAQGDKLCSSGCCKVPDTGCGRRRLHGTLHSQLNSTALLVLGGIGTAQRNLLFASGAGQGGRAVIPTCDHAACFGICNMGQVCDQWSPELCEAAEGFRSFCGFEYQPNATLSRVLEGKELALFDEFCASDESNACCQALVADE